MMNGEIFEIDLKDAYGNGISGNGISGNGISGNGLLGNGISGNGLEAEPFLSEAEFEDLMGQIK